MRNWTFLGFGRTHFEIGWTADKEIFRKFHYEILKQETIIQLLIFQGNVESGCNKSQVNRLVHVFRWVITLQDKFPFGEQEKLMHGETKTSSSTRRDSL